MPVNIKPRQISVKDPQTGQYKDFDMLTDGVTAVNNKSGNVSLDAGDINVDNSAQNPETLVDALQEVVAVSNTQPQSEYNELWIKPTVQTSVQVPTYQEFTEGLGDVSRALSDLGGSIAPVETTATATAAHAVGELFVLGETLMVALSAIAIGDTITTEGGSPNAAVTTISAKLIKDVQVNGSSILSNGVANIPVSKNNTLGLIGLVVLHLA